MLSANKLALLNTCLVYDLGVKDYLEALELQERLAAARVAGEIGDVMLLLEHPSVFTIGRSGEVDNILAPGVIRQNTPVFYTNRGGDITYHGPGQLVGYPIFSLKESGLSAHQYVWNLEETVIKALACLGITGHRVAGYPGVWVDDEKVCSLGLRVAQGVSRYGFTLNVNTDLKYFAYIVPCGIADKGVTSVSKISGQEVDMGWVKECVIRSFSQVFGVNLKQGGNIETCLVV